jgi:hypothetical protein
MWQCDNVKCRRSRRRIHPNRTGELSFTSWCRGLSNPEIHWRILVSHSEQWWSGVRCSAQGSRRRFVRESLLAAAASMLSASSAVDLGQTETSRRQLCSASKSYPGSNFRKGSVSWCVSGMSCLTSMGIIFNASTSSHRTPPRQV